MLRYKDVQGTVFTGATPGAVVRQMRRASWHTRSKHSFMQGVAKRLRVLGTKSTEYGTCQGFLDSLVASGWLRQV